MLNLDLELWIMNLMTVYSYFTLIYLLLIEELLINTSGREFSFRGLDAIAFPPF